MANDPQIFVCTFHVTIYYWTVAGNYTTSIVNTIKLMSLKLILNHSYSYHSNGCSLFNSLYVASAYWYVMMYIDSDEECIFSMPKYIRLKYSLNTSNTTDNACMHMYFSIVAIP